MGFKVPMGARDCQTWLPGCCRQGPDFRTCPSQRGHRAPGDAPAIKERRAWPGPGHFVMHNII